MVDIKEDIYSVKERLSRVCTNNMELRGTLREVIKKCEIILMDKNVSNEAFRLSSEIISICKDGGM